MTMIPGKLASMGYNNVIFGLYFKKYLCIFIFVDIFVFLTF